MGITLLPNKKNGGKMENNQTPVTQTEDKTVVVDNQTTNQTETKTYTREEYNALDKKLKAKYEKKYEGIDIAKYKEWQESQKIAEEKNAETLKENETLKARIVELENMQVVANAGIDSKFQKFVLSEVSQMEGDFEDNLKNYIKDNSQYLQTKEAVEAPKSTGVAVTKINENADTGVSAILKAKHPELFK